MVVLATDQNEGANLMLSDSGQCSRFVQRVVVLCCLFVLAVASLGRSQTAPMSNDDVIALVEGGLGAAVLTAAISRAETVDFDVDAGLLQLAQAGVPDEVITAMMEKQSAQDDAAALAATAAELSARPSPGIYLVQADGAEMRLDPTTYAAQNASGWRSRLTLGIARDQLKATVPRSRAVIRAASFRPTFRFVFPLQGRNEQATFQDPDVTITTSADGWWIRTHGLVTNPNQFALAQFEVREGRRELVVGLESEFRASRGPRGEDMREFEYQMLEPGIYEVTVTQTLGSGEFCFFPILSGNVDGDRGGAGSNQIFDFGVGP